jgi:hypothetical protein
VARAMSATDVPKYPFDTKRLMAASCIRAMVLVLFCSFRLPLPAWLAETAMGELQILMNVR